MTRLPKRTRAGARSCGTSAKEYRYFCGLFEDMIFLDLCLLRRRELNGKAGFSCSGCSKDTLMQSRSGRIADLSGFGPLTGKTPAEMRRSA